MNIIFCGGGTAGHINPAIAIADYISGKEKCTVSFCGGKGNLEETLVPKLGYKIDCFPMRGLKRGKSPKALFYNLGALMDTEKAIHSCKKIIRERKPDVVIGTGGYACFPMLKAAADLGVPSAVFEANAVAGVAIKQLASKVDCVLLAYENTKKDIKAKRIEITGAPVRQELVSCYKTKQQSIFTNGLPTVLSFWGSVGAQFMNEKMTEYLKIVAEKHEFNHIHATGRAYFEKMSGELSKALKSDNIQLRDYIYNMGDAMSQADLTLCRAGGTISELCVAGMPSVLVPSPYVAEHHQERNAQVLKNAGAAEVLDEKTVTPQEMYEKVRELVFDKQRLCDMSKNAKTLGHPNALEQIYSTVKSIIR